jgi:hypothetical protein
MLLHGTGWCLAYRSSIGYHGTAAFGASRPLSLHGGNGSSCPKPALPLEQEQPLLRRSYLRDRSGSRATSGDLEELAGPAATRNEEIKGSGLEG